MIPDIADILSRLIAFPTVSRRSNLALLDYVESLLAPADVRLERFASNDGTRANLMASLGPEGSGGVVLSGHCDVVPATGQDWSVDPFVLHRIGDRLYGRGAADMKGFLAVAIHAILKAAKRELRLPLHLAISYDEEIGCMGVRGMLDTLSERPERPAMCIIGEPTGMRIANGHKGKRALRAYCHGRPGHSALAPDALNALHLGAALVTHLQERQEQLRLSGARDAAYDIPYSTIHVGMMSGGTALNVVPARCDLDIEIRNIVEDEPDLILAGIVKDAQSIAASHRERFPEASITVEEVSSYPGLDTTETAPAVSLMQSLLGTQEPLIKVAFGTEGGLFHERLGVPTLVCGPGHMAQGHKKDEFVEISQLAKCMQLLEAVTRQLEQGNNPVLSR